MIDATSALIVAVAGALISGLGAALVTGKISLRVAAADRKERRREQLAAALIAFGAAVDHLFLETEQLPRAGNRWSKRAARQLDRMPVIAWLNRLLGRRLLGREMWRALDDLIDATNRLVVVAPEGVLPSVVAVNELLARFEERGPDWREEWQAARGEVLRTARAELDPRPPWERTSVDRDRWSSRPRHRVKPRLRRD